MDKKSFPQSTGTCHEWLYGENAEIFKAQPWLNGISWCMHGRQDKRMMPSHLGANTFLHKVNEGLMNDLSAFWFTFKTKNTV